MGWQARLPSPLAEFIVKFLSPGWFQRRGRMDAHPRSAIRDVTKWVSQGFGVKKSHLDSSPPSPGSLRLPHVVHSAHIIFHYTLQMGNLFSFYFYINIFKMCENIGTYSEWLPSERAPTANTRACIHIHLVFILYFADGYQTQRLSKC